MKNNAFLSLLVIGCLMAGVSCSYKDWLDYSLHKNRNYFFVQKNYYTKEGFYELAVYHQSSTPEAKLSIYFKMISWPPSLLILLNKSTGQYIILLWGTFVIQAFEGKYEFLESRPKYLLLAPAKTEVTHTNLGDANYIALGEDLLVNGGFEEPHVEGRRLVTSIPGWTGKAEIGLVKEFQPFWNSKTTSQVALVNKHSQLYQKVILRIYID